MLDFFRGKYSWRKLATLVRQLPSSSRTTEAMANDDDLAESMGEQPKTDRGPSISEYTPEAARLDALIDRVGELVAVTIQVAGGKAPRVRPAKRPETAFTRAERRRSERKLGALIAEVEAAQQRYAEAEEN